MTRHVLSRWFAGIGGQATTTAEVTAPEHDARVRRAVSTAPVVLFEVDVHGLYTCVAGGHVEMFGIHPAQLIGRSIFDFPKFVPGKNLMVRRALAGETVSFSGIWPRGRFIIQLVPRLGPDRRVAAVVGLGFEVTKPKANDAHLEQLLEALRQSEARFRVMCDSAPLAICVSNTHLELGYANAALCDMLGREPNELLGRGWEVALRPEQAATMRLLRGRAARDRRLSSRGKLKLVHKDGSTVWTSLRVAEMRDDGELIGYVVTLADITRERSARGAKERARRDLRRVIEASPEGIAILREWRCLFANRALVAALGYEHAQQLIGCDVRKLIHPRDLPIGCAQTEISPASIVGPLSRAHELRCLRADGGYALLELRGAELTEFDGAPATLLSARDVTETKSLQARLLVSERLSSVGSLAAGVAHEINNPLAAVLLHLDWLSAQLAKLETAQLSGTELHSQLRRLSRPVNEAREAGARVRDIVRDLNVFSRPEDETQGPVDLGRVLESALRLAWNELRQRAKLVRDWGALPNVYGNEARLGQVLLNLLINAAHAIDDGHAQTHEIKVSARVTSATHVAVEVHDTGRGIPPEILDRIFDPFFTTKPPGVGTGLGLSICQRLVTNMGGQIEVESRLGHGTTFRVTLLSAAPLTEPKTVSPPPVASLPQGHLMVIDDDPGVASALDRILTPEHHVRVFTSARPALEELRAGAHYDVVLCDVMMPDMSGIDFYTELQRSHPKLADQVIFVTGGTCNAHARAFLDRVDNPRLYKPFDSATLHALVGQQLTHGAR